MAKKMGRVLVVDLEATCWDGLPPEGETSDIIEIGLCVVELATLERTEKRSLIVRPERSRVSEFCTKLTTLTPEQVEAGMAYAEACRILEKEFDSRQRAWLSYGDYDRTMIEGQCRQTGVRNPFGGRHTNLKTLWAMAHALPYEIGMAQAVNMAGLTLEGTHHRGDDDAWNIAALFVELMRKLRS